MKCKPLEDCLDSPRVASLAEAWIEIYAVPGSDTSASVASLAEAWIEITKIPEPLNSNGSPPSRRRGLKYI